MNTRSPSEARPPRMEALSRLPVFFALAQKRAVVAGGSAAAAWKAELLAAAGAKVDAYAVEISDETRELARETPRITIHPHAIAAADLDGAALAIGACDNASVARESSKRRGFRV